MRNGISLVSLMVAIVIIILLISTVSISAISSINNARKINFATEISFIQESVNSYYTKNNALPILEKIDFDFSKIDEKYMEQFVSEDTIEMYKLDLKKLGKIDTVFGKGESKNDFYVVSLNTNNVYYLAGINVGDKIYYTLTDDLMTVIRYNKNTLNDGIIFSKSEKKWTNKNISTNILIPNEYENVEVNVQKDDKIISNIFDYTNEKNYNKYVVQGVEGCYSIKVKYLKDDIIKSISYEVNNFDNISPTYSLSNKKVLDNGKDKYCYIELNDVLDNASGMYKMKYLKSNASLKEVRDGGINIENNIMEFNEDTKYLTLYIEDNATNYIYKVIELRG